MSGLELQKLKYEYLLERGLKFVQGKNEFVIGCEFCEKLLKGRITISKKGSGYDLSVEGEFHHDQKEILHLYCGECHKRIHDWGIIQRWLKRAGKSVEDLPDSIGIPPGPRHSFW